MVPTLDSSNTKSTLISKLERYLRIQFDTNKLQNVKLLQTKISLENYNVTLIACRIKCCAFV